jgi:hypothetical protein
VADRAGLAYRVEHLVLDPTNRQVRGVDIAAAIIDESPPQLTLTIEGASTLEITVLDTDLKLLRGDLLTGWAWGTNADDRDEKHWILDGRAVDAKLDDLWFRLVKVSKQSSDTLVLTFEDRLVALLRAHAGARKVYRDNMTRAQFVKALCNAADVPTHIPELNKRQPIAKASQKVTEADRTSEGKQGLDKSAKITIKGQKATRTQLSILERGLDAAMSLDPPEKALLALLVAVIGESTVSYVVNSSGHGGPWQSSSIDAHDVEKQAHYFMAGGHSFLPEGAIKLARSQPSLKPGDIATKVEISGKPGSFYQTHIAEAKKILAAYGGNGSSLSVEVEQPYAFARGKHENSWDAIQRLAQEVNFRAFIRGDALWYVSEEYLFAQKPQVALVEGEGAVDEITFDIDIGARNLVTELVATVHAARWTLKAGMIGRVDEQGPADGRWVLHQVELALDGDLATATFNKPIPVKAEPAPETSEVSLTAGGNVSSEAAGPLGQMLAKAIGISNRDMPYVWGGGHNSSFAPTSGGYDCSGYVSAILNAGGLLSSPLTSAGLESWGKPGKGRYFTVYANSGHTFIVFHGLGKYKRADTSPQGGESRKGPHVRTQNRSTAGFVARHYSGL